LVYDGDNLNVVYDAYAVNGFSGADAPTIGAGTPDDNNFMKGVGARLKVGLLGSMRLTGSLYYDLWDQDNKYAVAFYSVGLELMPGLVHVPILRKIRLRGEWARGEIQLPPLELAQPDGSTRKVETNHQRGLVQYAFARAGYYAELSYLVSDWLSLRARVGRVNADNTKRNDPRDVDVWEPALRLGNGKMIVTIAYQMVARVNRPYDAKAPADVLYSKFFLQY